MKKVLVALFAAVMMAGCGDPLPQDQWVQTKIDLTQVQGLEDCRYLTIQTRTNSHPIIVIRCPSSATVTQWSEPQGKTTVSRSAVVVDDNQLRELERQLKAADSEHKARVEQIQRQLEAARSGK